MDPNTRSLVMGAAGGAGAEKIYVEDVFSTFLYTGNGSTQTITNGIDLSGKGGLVWIKYRDGVFGNGHYLYDTARGAGKALQSNLTDAETGTDNRLTSFNSTGFSLDVAGGGALNASAYNYASWTFRKAAKFFDVVTYTGTGSPRTIAHNLGSIPGCIIVKRTDTTGQWFVYHRSTGASAYLLLNSTNAVATGSSVWNNASPTSTSFQVVSTSDLNANGGTYVAYLFAHDAGGFGDSGNESVVSCGSFNDTSAGTVNLGWEPQWILTKFSGGDGSWQIWDSMRGFAVSGNNALLIANSSATEAGSSFIRPTSTGFSYPAFGQGNIIYIAIRRGPMKTPTDATKVFNALKRTGTGSTVTTTAGLTPDLAIINYLPGSGDDHFFHDRLRGQASLGSTTSNSEATGTSFPKFDQMSGVQLLGAQYNSNGASMIDWYFRRAPGFFDIVAYTGTGSARTVAHNLGVAPELMIVKRRNQSGPSWYVYDSINGSGYYLNLNATSGRNSAGATAIWNNTAPTASVFTVGTDADVNGSTYNYIAYLFASCPGVSKVGSYTGTGTTLNVDCGFTTGARFVLIKRTDSAGDWYVWDTARGIVSGNDPYLLLNSTAAEVTSTDYIDPLSSGFQISSTAPAAINASGGSFVFLAIS